MKREKRQTILFSCLGSTDPVRGEHDGAMLHIARHYRPDKIFWYITKEMREANERDHRFELSVDFLKRQCPGYEPEILPPCFDEREDASDFDGFYDVFQRELVRLSRQYPGSELLVNLSSGTPQMKTTLALLASTLQFPMRAIQVKNFEKSAGTSERTNSKNYDLEYELELNEDAEPDAPNRCSEPRLLLIQREKQRAQIESLLRRYDYEALLAVSGTLPENLRTLIRHLAYRSAYNLPEAWREAQQVRGLDLYPADQKNAPTYRTYRELSEYLLILKLMQRTQRYTDLVIRLNPLVIRLQMAWLEKEGVHFSQLAYMDRHRGWIADPEIIRRHDPELAGWLDQEYRPYRFRAAPVSISFCNRMVRWIGREKTGDGLLFEKLEQLNHERNESAHTLNNVTEEDIRKIMDFPSERLIKELVRLLAEVFPQHYREELFSIYDAANRCLREIR